MCNTITEYRYYFDHRVYKHYCLILDRSADLDLIILIIFGCY